MNVIFDLDNTVINSSHRFTANAQGSLDLEAWVRDSTPENVAKDSVMPLVRLMRSFYRKHTVIVCTARVFRDADYAFMIENDLPYHELLARPDGCTLQDAFLKDIQLRLYAERNDLSWKRFCKTAIMIDDNAKVISHMQSTGLTVYNAIVLNSRSRKVS